MNKAYPLICAVALLSACGGGNKEPKTVVDDAPAPKPADTVTAEDLAALEADAQLKFDEEAAEVVLKRGARKAQNCPKTTKAPEGEGEIIAVFDGPKGRIVEVELPYLWMDAPANAQKCIQKAFIGEIIPPFEGTKKVPFQLKIGGEKEEKK